MLRAMLLPQQHQRHAATLEFLVHLRPVGHRLRRALVEARRREQPPLQLGVGDLRRNWPRIPITLARLTYSETAVLPIPTNLSGTAISPSQINLTWTASTDNVGVTGYKIFRDGTQIGTSPSTSFSSTGLAASTVYSYTVSAYDAAGNNSGQSASAPIITLGAGAPTIAVGSRVVTTANLNVRSSASASASKLGTESIGSLGTAIGGPTSASGHTWWQINWDNAISGWSVGDYLGAASAASSPAVGMSAPSSNQSLIAQLTQQLQSLLAQLQNLQSQTAAAGATVGQ